MGAHHVHCYTVTLARFIGLYHLLRSPEEGRSMLTQSVSQKRCQQRATEGHID